MKNKRFTIWHKIGAVCGAGLLAAAASTAAVNSGDATLDNLEIKIDGQNIVTGFSSNNKTYTIELGEDASSMATFSAVPKASDAVVDISVNGTTLTNHSLASLTGGDNVVTYAVKSGSRTETYTVNIKTPQVVRENYFTWKNANIYFVLTDRFYDGDPSNNNSYHRKRMSGDADVATFHGGDIKGLTEKLDYLDKLGVNAIWITAPYEQMHGWTGGKNDAFPHYAFHGYYALDWTYMDRNMGTIEEMKTFVTEAHKRGIRVVMDIVMNHTGYGNLDDAVEYDFGNFNGNPQAGWVPSSTPYSMWSESNAVSFNANEQGKWGNWWGPWVRAFGDRSWASNAGFAPEGGSDYTKPLAGLPDIVTERTQSVDIPPFLKKKWNAEKGGDYDKYRLPNLENWRAGNKGAPADYIVNWLAGWVEYFGIDGFRCDTAKHLEKSRWAQLKNACKTALRNWRNSDRADEYAKNWDEDFWMTGEAFGWDHGDVGYFTEGGFDSMINFAFNSSEGSQGRTPSTEDWKYYANYCNGSNGRQVLNYVSSHDTGLHRPGDQKKVATMLLLCPGGAQIYYGDETSRPYMSGCGGDQSMQTRSDFNWSAVDNDDNKHWQKIGQFRRRNAAVGAGTQTELGDNTYGRKFSENGYSNAVVIKLNTSAGQSYTVNVNGFFNDGERVMDGYNTDNSATVSGGKVTLTASGPVLLIEPYGTIGDNPTPPTPPRPRSVVTASPAPSTFTDNVTVSLSASPEAAIYYTIDGSTPGTSSLVYSSPLTFSQTTTVKTLTVLNGVQNTQSFTWTKQGDNPGPQPDQDEYYVYFNNSSNWTPYVWAWNDTDNCCTNGTWPGDAMTQKDGKYYWAAPSGKVPTMIIISNNGGEKAGNGNLKYVNKATYNPDGTTGGDTPGPQPGNGLTIYYDNSSSNWSSVKVHYFGGSEQSTWPGVDMTKHKDNIYKYVVPSGTTGLVFNNGSGDQGGDLKAVDNHLYDKNSDKGVYNGGDDPNPGPNPPNPSGVKVFYKGNWSSVNAYIYKAGSNPIVQNAAWPGASMTKESGKDYFSYTVPEGLASGAKVIFNNGTDQYPTDVEGQECGLDLNGSSMMLDGTSWNSFSEGPQKPSISISPNGGKVKGSSTIAVNIANNATSITASFNGRSLTLNNGSNNVTVSSYLNDGATGSLSVSATNDLGTTTANVSFTRDDSTPVYDNTLTGDHRELSIYQVMVASFQHGNGGASGYSDLHGPNGHTKNGNLRGIINALDYIKGLGMNAIWMTPIFNSEGCRTFGGGTRLEATGYYATNFFEVDPKFGSLDEFKELVNKAHEKGMYIILDGVFGHSGADGSTLTSPNGKKCYVKGQMNVANVRGSESGNIAFPESLDYFKEVIRYWMELGVDGWRLDQCYQVYQNGHNYWKDLREECEAVARERKNRGEKWGTLGFMVGEDWANANGITTTRQNGLKSVMDFDGKDNLVGLGYGVGSIGWFLSTDAQGRGYESGVNPTIFLSNHDMARPGDKIDVNSKVEELMTRHAAVAAYSGPTCTYYGDEIGDKSGSGCSDGDKSRTSGRISGFNGNEQKLHDYVAKVFKARASNPALWRGTAERKGGSNGAGNGLEVITKTDSQTGNKVICIFSQSNQSVNIGGSGVDLINGGNVSGTVNVQAWVPAFIKMN